MVLVITCLILLNCLRDFKRDPLETSKEEGRKDRKLRAVGIDCRSSRKGGGGGLVGRGS